MRYEEFKDQLAQSGWSVQVRYMGTGVESGCIMRNMNKDYVITVNDESDGVTASASVCLPGFMQPITTGDFGCPWKNEAFFTQVRRLCKIKRIIGESLKEI
ncbi:hypothetical protein OMDBNIEC_00041 [Salmonella phage STP-SP5]|nr:hypothetical protein OMDBNIEC_00041 [Salmonella phage STP-SP5]